MIKAALFTLALAVVASAHFQVIYTPSVETDDKQFSALLFFTHPYNAEPVLKTGLDENGAVHGIKDIYMVHNGKSKNMLWALRDITFSTLADKGPAQKLYVDQSAGFKSAGDYAIVTVPHPYWEPSENLYIQQVTKLIVNRGGFDTDWSKPCVKGYTEIIPLVKPTQMTPGSLFRAVVLDGKGKPVPHCTVEIEYLNATIDMAGAKITANNLITNEKVGAATVLTDANGVFEYIPKRAGYWGFAALSAGSDKTYRGKELEQDPVIWIQVTPE